MSEAPKTNTTEILRQIAGLVNAEYDFGALVLSVGDTVETYTFRNGGSGGTIVRVLTITYTDATRGVISNFERTA